MIRQDHPAVKDFKLPDGKCTFGTDACAVSTVFEIVEQRANRYYSPELVKLYTEVMYRMGFLDKEFTIPGPENWEGCFRVLGLDVECRYIDDLDYVCTLDEEEALKLVKPKYQHFVRGNGKAQYSHDSLGPRAAQRDYKVGSRRIFIVRRIM